MVSSIPHQGAISVPFGLELAPCLINSRPGNCPRTSASGSIDRPAGAFARTSNRSVVNQSGHPFNAKERKLECEVEKHTNRLIHRREVARRCELHAGASVTRCIGPDGRHLEYGRTCGDSGTTQSMNSAAVISGILDMRRSIPSTCYRIILSSTRRRAPRLRRPARNNAVTKFL